MKVIVPQGWESETRRTRCGVWSFIRGMCVRAMKLPSDLVLSKGSRMCAREVLCRIQENHGMPIIFH